jgi:hypothetical protein
MVMFFLSPHGPTWSLVLLAPFLRSKTLRKLVLCIRRCNTSRPKHQENFSDAANPQSSRILLQAFPEFQTRRKLEYGVAISSLFASNQIVNLLVDVQDPDQRSDD